ncbi:MAG: LPXTG cell wall anchor domain-containing protein [Clostridia bacterium]
MKSRRQARPGEITNPQTGDNIIMFIIIFALALTGILVTFIINKKRVKNNK